MKSCQWLTPHGRLTPWSHQEQVSAAIALAVEQQTQKLLMETQLDVTEFDNLLQPIIDTCTKDAISVSATLNGPCSVVEDSTRSCPGESLWVVGRETCSQFNTHDRTQL